MAVASARAGGWIRRFHPAPEAATRLVCFPHAGGSSTYYFPVSRALSPGLDVLAVQYPGRQDRRSEPFVDDLHELAGIVAGELEEFLDRPLALFGHSMGATLAFEVALLLQERGHAPVALFASGRRAPSCHRDEHVHESSDEAVVAELARVGGTYGDMLDDPEVLSMILPAIRNDYRAAETYRYRPGPVLGCPVVALTGDQDPYVTADEAAAWQRHTGSGFELRVLRGGHFFLAERAPEVLRTISDTLGEDGLVARSAAAAAKATEPAAQAPEAPAGPLGELASPQAGSLGDAAILAIPLGATEQHGPHLPLSTDTDIAERLCRRLAAERPGVLVAPALPYGASDEHAGFPGTLSIGQEALELVVLQLARSAAATAPRVLLVNGHGGNAEPLHRAVARLRAEGLDVRAHSPRWDGDAHAGHVETSLQLALDPDRVRMEHATAGNGRPLAELMPLLRAGGVRAVDATGVLGDPTTAAAEDGHALWRTLESALAAAVEAWWPARPATAAPAGEPA